MGTGGDDRRTGKAIGDDARPAFPRADVSTPSVTPPGGDDPPKPRGTETWEQAAEAGGGEVRATKDTPEPDSLGG
jgi:hypothetical protein